MPTCGLIHACCVICGDTGKDADLKLVGHHVPKALIVYRPNEDVGSEGLASVPTDHGFPCTHTSRTQVSP